MSLVSVEYFEFEDQPTFWELKKCDFVAINLVVGKNSTGKSRLINVIDGLCKMLAGVNTAALGSGSYVANFLIESVEYTFHIHFRENKVLSESLTVDGEEKLSRNSDGDGRIYFEHQKEWIDFKVSPSVIAFQQRMDELQHPFVVKLAKWASEGRAYSFSMLNHGPVIPVRQLSITADSGSLSDGVVMSYVRAFEVLGKELDESIISDMAVLGYRLVDVGVDDIRGALGLQISEPLLGLIIVEADQPAVKVPQPHMSWGLLRALSLVIHLNIAARLNRRNLILVDDIGEGLDYERATGVISVLMRHAEETGAQLIMTSNDRFVMNNVPLDDWILLRRNGHTVDAITKRTHPARFEEFKYMGLSNFDFFTSEK